MPGENPAAEYLAAGFFVRGKNHHITSGTDVPKEEIMANQEKQRFEMGMACLKGGSYDAIFGRFKNRLQGCTDPVNRTLITLDFVQEIKALYDQARAEFNQAIVQRPDSHTAYFYKGVSSLIGSSGLLGGSFLDKAMACLNTASIMNREDPLPYYVRAKAWIYKEDFSEALEEAGEAVELAGNSPLKPDFEKLLASLETDVNEYKFIEYVIGGHDDDTVKEKNEARNDTKTDESWTLIDREHRFKILPGAFLRQYVSPYHAPDKSYFKEYEVEQEPHDSVITHYRARGMPLEMIGFANGSTSQTNHFFGNEIWIKTSTLRHPFRKYFKLDDE
jgi:tetratricopeptide (TPR) repeat protein